MQKHNHHPTHNQKIVRIQRAGDHSLHNPIPKKQKRNFIPLILIVIFFCFSAWGIKKYLNYRSQRAAVENYAQGVKDLTDGNFSDAAKSLEKSIANGNNDIDASLKLGVSKYNQKDFAGAIEAYSKALEKDPLNATATNGIGNVYRDQKEFNKAQEQYEKAIQLDPTFAPAYANLSIMFLDLDRKKEAADIVKEGLEKIPSSMELKNIQTIVNPE